MNKPFAIYPDLGMIQKICSYFEQFLPLSLNEMAELMKYCEIRQFEKRTVIVEEGEMEYFLNMVITGLVMKYVKMPGEKRILQLATEGHVISAEISFLTRCPSTVVIETLEPTLMISLRNDKMEEALEKFSRGEELGRRILGSMYVKKDIKKFWWLSMGVRERFLHYIEHHPHMLQRVPQKYLASYLNIKPETFSRLKHLIRKNKNLEKGPGN